MDGLSKRICGAEVTSLKEIDKACAAITQRAMTPESKDRTKHTMHPETIAECEDTRMGALCAVLERRSFIMNSIGAPNGLRYPLVGGTRQRHFDGTNFKPRKLPENAQTPTSRVHAVLARCLPWQFFPYVSICFLSNCLPQKKIPINVLYAHLS